jgi:WD40 repeat protein
MACPTELRDREWAHLLRICSAELVKIDASAKKVRFSPDGKKVLGIAANPTLWDAHTGELLSKAVVGFTLIGAVITDVVFGPDGNRVISVSNGRRALDFSGFSKDKVNVEHPGFLVRVLDPRQLSLVGGFHRKGEFGEAVLSPDGLRVLLIDSSVPPKGLFATPSSVCIYETYTGRRLCQLDVPKDRPVMQAFLDTNGRALTWTLSEHVIRVWDAITGSPLRVLDLSEHGISNVAVSSDGTRLAVSSYSNKSRYQVLVLDVDTGKEIVAFNAHQGNVVAMAFNSDGRRLATGGTDQVVKVWNLEVFREEFAFRGHMGAIADVAFSADGTRIASCDKLSQGTIRIWDARPESAGTH